MKNKIRLPDKKNIFVTSNTDPIKYYYSFPFSYFYLKRLKLIYSMMEGKHFGKLLELGYGSGLSLLELSTAADEVHGIDTHDNLDKVYAMLAKESTSAKLVKGNITSMPYSDNEFDCIVAISIFEHIADLEKTMQEIYRILKPGGILLAGFPSKSKITDMLFASVGFDYNKEHISGHKQIIAALNRHFNNSKLLLFPSFIPAILSLYRAGTWTKSRE